MIIEARRPFDSFMSLLAEGDVVLSPHFIQASSTLRYPIEAAYTQGKSTGFVAQDACDTLDTHPNVSLANKKISVDRYPEDTAVLQILVNVVNASIEPIVDLSRPDFYSAGTLYTLHCADAEVEFGRTLKFLKGVIDDDTQSSSLPGAQIVACDGRPVFIRKHNGEKSALTLEDIIVNGVVIPAGSIVSLFMTGDLQINGAHIPYYSYEGDDLDYEARHTRHTTYSHEPRTNSYTTEVLPIERVAKVLFLRLSAFALSALERVIYYPHPDSSCESWWDYPEGQEVLARYDLATISSVAHAALRRANLPIG